MKNSSKAIWFCGLVTGAIAGAYLYQNKDEIDLEKQKKKMNKLLSEFQSIAGDLKDRLLSASEDGIAASKTALEAAKNSAKEAKEKVANKI